MYVCMYVADFPQLVSSQDRRAAVVPVINRLSTGNCTGYMYPWKHVPLDLESWEILSTL